MSVTVRAVTRETAEDAPSPRAESCTVIIFGATGDLTQRKLMLALYGLQCVGELSNRCEVIGTGRTPLSGEEFRARMREAAAASRDGSDADDPRWREFEQRLRYLAGDPNDPAFYPELAAELEARRQDGASPNYLFYVATPASLARPIIEGLGTAGLARNAHGWSRIVLEKPFGRDLESARELNLVVNDVFPEDAVFRIDHYLGKETVQNLLVFRFGNSIFEPVWNRNYVEYVEITAAEELGVEHRAAFYEETGALRDMVANHLLQLLTLTAMEPPAAFDADAVRGQKVEVLRAMPPMTVEEVLRRTVRGQYRAGTVGGIPVPGYRDEPGVSRTSLVETFAAIEFHVDNWRWAGVPFYVRAGKRLGRKMTEIMVHFRRTPQTLFASTLAAGREPNLITLRIQPGEGITITFAAKQPGSEMRPLPVEAEFAYAKSFPSELPDAYATLLLDAMRGDGTLFTRRDEVEAAWRIITPIEEAWARLPPPPFPNYAAGSDGPAEVQALMHGRACHAWCAIEPTACPGSPGS
ncbi:MAG: glucose-6-phosphate dehydrogenase [Gemmatimonadaceae bacterium]|nr:glucose-6-phosphate dehydrogenase [Gemmatimonadaceae bacterium]